MGDDKKGGEEILEIDGREVRITSPGKVFFPERGETKLDLVNHYIACAEPLMRTMGDRPLQLQRFPKLSGKVAVSATINSEPTDFLCEPRESLRYGHAIARTLQLARRRNYASASFMAAACWRFCAICCCACLIMSSRSMMIRFWISCVTLPGSWSRARR